MDMNYARTLTDGGTGFRYETKITALFALRLNNYFYDFYLASNFQKGGKFDDIVFSFDHDGEWKTWFIQLKHRLPTTLHKKKITKSALTYKGDLALKYYFESYKQIARKFSSRSNDPIFRQSFSQVRFAIFTNGILHEEILNEKPNTVECEILSTNVDHEQNIMLDIRCEVFRSMRQDWYIGDFVDRLFFFTRQAGEGEIDNLIQQEIKAAVKDLKTAELKLITHEWTNYVQRWSSSGQFLVKEEVQRTLMRLSKEAQYGKRDNDASIRFIDSFLRFEEGHLVKDNLIYVQSEADSTMMSMVAFSQMGLLKEPNLSVNLRYLEHDDEMEHLSTTWHRSNDIVLVIDCEGDNLGINVGKIIRFIMNLLQTPKRNRIILVSTKSNATAGEISLQLQAKRRKFNCTLKNLSDDSKAMLKEREVDFQGYKTTLGSLLNGKALDDVFDMSAITQILQGRMVKIGLKPVEHIPYYVPRLLTRQACVPQTLFTSFENDAIFALSGITIDDAYSTFHEVTSSTAILASLERVTKSQIVVLEDDCEDAFKAMTQLVTLPMHWFERHKKDSRLWRWKRSTSNIQDFADDIQASRDFVATDNIMAIKEKLVVITAEPGMGKSTLLQHLAAETKKAVPHMWVISLVLNDYTEYFDRDDFMRNIQANTKNLIAVAAGVDKETSKFDARLFNQCYDATGNMVVLLDGFDEITPYYTKQGLAFLNVLQNSNIYGVWVTARPILREILENEVFSLSYTIKPFVLKDQRNFLLKYWEHQLPHLEHHLLSEFVERVLKVVNESFDQKLAQFTGIPLQTRMVAEVFTEEIMRFNETGSLDDLCQTVDGVQLFDDFVRIKRGIQMEKSKLPASARWESERLNEQREQELMKLALLTLLPRDVCNTLVPPITDQNVRELRELVNNGHEKSGIVLSYKAESPQFIHRTFAEYFVALFFAKNFASNRRFMSGDTFFSLPFEFVKYFFDNMLAAGCKLHVHVLRREKNEGLALLATGIDLNAVDAGGRTALHLAAAMPDAVDIIDLLINSGAVVDIHDAVLGASPIDYALKTDRVNNVGRLLEFSKGTKKNVSVTVTWQNLQLAVKGDYVQLFKYLLENGLLDSEPLSQLTPQKWLNNWVSFGLTILHIVAAFNAQKIFKYLMNDEDTREITIMLLEMKSGDGLTPLLQAASAGHFSMARALVDAGADPLATTPKGKNLAEYAIKAHDLDLVCDILSARGLQHTSYLSGAVTALVSGKSEWAYKALELLFTTFPELLTVKTTKNVSLIFAAVNKGNHKVVRLICELGGEVNEVAALGTPLHYAVIRGHDNVVRELLECPRVVVDATDKEGCTPVYKAVSKGFSNIFQRLVASNANLHKIALNGRDLTHAVTDSCESSIFYYLLDNDFDFRRPNYDGDTGLSLLKRNQINELILALEPDFEIAEGVPSNEEAQKNGNNTKASPTSVRNRLKNLDIGTKTREFDENETTSNLVGPSVKNENAYPPLNEKTKSLNINPHPRPTPLGKASFLKVTTNGPEIASQKRSPPYQNIPFEFIPMPAGPSGQNRPHNRGRGRGNTTDRQTRQFSGPSTRQERQNQETRPRGRGRGGHNVRNRSSSRGRQAHNGENTQRPHQAQYKGDPSRHQESHSRGRGRGQANVPSSRQPHRNEQPSRNHQQHRNQTQQRQNFHGARQRRQLRKEEQATCTIN